MNSIIQRLRKNNQTMRSKLAVLALGFVLCLSAHGAVYSFTGPFENGGVIPDNNPIGLTDAHNITGEPTSITSIILTLHISGNYVDDLTGYLRLGNQSSSPSYDLTSNLSSGANDYTLNLSSTFSTYNPNDTWTIFFADTSPGGENTLISWGLNITAVPEPINIALGIFGVAVAVGSVGVRLQRGRNTERTTEGRKQNGNGDQRQN